MVSDRTAAFIEFLIPARNLQEIRSAPRYLIYDLPMRSAHNLFLTLISAWLSIGSISAQGPSPSTITEPIAGGVHGWSTGSSGLLKSRGISQTSIGPSVRSNLANRPAFIENRGQFDAKATFQLARSGSTYG